MKFRPEPFQALAIMNAREHHSRCIRLQRAVSQLQLSSPRGLHGHNGHGINRGGHGKPRPSKEVAKMQPPPR